MKDILSNLGFGCDFYGNIRKIDNKVYYKERKKE